MSNVLRGVDVRVDYQRDGGLVSAVRGVDLTVDAGEIVAIVGESGCGKSSLGRALVGLEPLAGGSVQFDGEDVVPLTGRTRPMLQRKLQMVFQDPFASLNPRITVGKQISWSAQLGGRTKAEARDDARRLVARVGLEVRHLDLLPRQFSGGQRQRIAIARALAIRPSCVVADEPISALDPTTQVEIAEMLRRLVDDEGLALVFVSHDLSAVRAVADRIAVMHLGKVVEEGATAAVWSRPAHPYTAALMRSIPLADGKGNLPVELAGDVPDPANPPRGCSFNPRCTSATDMCTTTEPPIQERRLRRFACWHPYSYDDDGTDQIDSGK